MKKYYPPSGVIYCVIEERSLLVASQKTGEIEGEPITWDDDSPGDGSISGEGIDWMD